jgi:predicted outer membrane repeat protein
LIGVAAEDDGYPECDTGDIWRIDCQSVPGKRGFIFQTGETEETIVENFEVYRGNAGLDDGGGIYAYGASPMIISCTVACCSGENGGGIFCDTNSNLRMINCAFLDNYATGDGGGICSDSSSPTIEYCRIGADRMGNTAYGDGGGIYCYNSCPSISHCTIEANWARWWGGGICCSMGPDPVITDCIITGN